MRQNLPLNETKKGSRKLIGATPGFLTLFHCTRPAFTTLKNIESQCTRVGGTYYSSLTEMPRARLDVQFSLKDATITNVTHPMVTSRKSTKLDTSDSMSTK